MIAQTRSAHNGLINHEELRVQIMYDGSDFSVHLPIVDTTERNGQLWDQRLYTDDRETLSYGLSPWGSSIVLDIEDESSVQETVKDATIVIPFAQKFARLSIGGMG